MIQYELLASICMLPEYLLQLLKWFSDSEDCPLFKHWHEPARTTDLLGVNRYNFEGSLGHLVQVLTGIWQMLWGTALYPSADTYLVLEAQRTSGR